MQSCSRSSLGRWSMEVLRGSMERGFFFFNKLKSGDTHPYSYIHTVTVYTHNFKNTFS